MANLAEAVDATETDWIISADISDDIDFLTVEDEIVHVTANFPAQYQAATGTTSAPRIRVERGAGGTTAASHADTTALTPLIPPSSSAGAGGVTINLTGTETEQGNLYRGDAEPTDPTPIEGDVWVDTTGGAPFQIKTFAEDEWVIAPLVAKDALGVITAQVDVDPQGAIRATSVAGDAELKVAADGEIHMTQGDGDVLIQITAGGGIALERGVSAVRISSGDVIDVTAGAALAVFDPSGTVTLGGTLLGLTFDAVLPSLPTADPVVAGALWNDAGTVKVSAG